jgi:AraC-like DNA-binding protein
MKFVLNIWVLLSLLGAAQGIFLSFVLLINKRGNRKANRILGILILLFSLRLLEFAGYWTTFFVRFPHLSFLTVSFPFLFGLHLYLYAKYLTTSDRNFKPIEWLQFFPFLLHFASMIPYYLERSDFKLAALNQIIFTDEPVFSTRFYFVRILQFLHMLSYTALTLVLLIEHNKKIAGKFPSTERINLKWLRNLTVGFGLFIVLDLFHFLEIWKYGYKHIVEVDIIILLFSAVFIYSLGYMALKQPEVYTGLIGKKNGPKYERSTLTPQQADAYLKDLIKVMKIEKPYINNEINLQNLAQRLSISGHHLSQIINDKLNQNFYDFINEYRIEEAKKRLSQPENNHYTILSIALDVGFNNKASFNNSFKKHAGMTPSQFRSSSKKPAL